MAPSSTKDLSLPNYFKQEGSDELRSLAVTEFSLGLTSLTQRQARNLKKTGFRHFALTTYVERLNLLAR